MLDIVRAARDVTPDVDVDAPVLLWGYSEGGRNAAWAAELQPEYAPDVSLVGLAAGGVPTDLTAVVQAIDGSLDPSEITSRTAADFGFVTGSQRVRRMGSPSRRMR